MSRASEMSKPCFSWQEPLLEGLGNGKSMRRERELSRIRLFRLGSGGPPQMEEENGAH